MILFGWAIEKIEYWLHCGFATDFARNAFFRFPDGLDASEQKEYLKKWRHFRTPLILGQNAFLPEARDVVWDEAIVTELGLDLGARDQICSPPGLMRAGFASATPPLASAAAWAALDALAKLAMVLSSFTFFRSSPVFRVRSKIP